MMTIKLLICNLASIVCAVASGFLCYKGVDGWGWFLFLTLLLHCTED